MVKNYDVTGMTCSACSSGIEKAVSKLGGVIKADVSLMGKSLRVEYDEKFSEQELFECVDSLGYGIYAEGAAPQQRQEAEDKKLLIRLIVSLCLLAPLMFIGMALPHIVQLGANLKWTALSQAALTAAVIGVNYKYFSKGFMALIKRSPNMDTLVALGSGVSFLYSLVLTVLLFFGITVGKSTHLYFDSAAMILTLVDVGKLLEEKSKRKTGNEVEKLLKLAPDKVEIEENGERKTVPIKEVKPGDVAVVLQGAYIPVDGVITEGHGFVDKSAITGESMPVEVGVGDSVTTASVNCGGVLKVRAERVGGETTLAQIIKMVRLAGASKAPIQKFADKVAGVFVPVVAALSLLTFGLWLLIDKAFVPEHCITYAISVLVVSCPCALGLATPVAVMTATGKAASLGVLYKDADALQKTREVNCVLLDKTATITQGRPQVCDLLLFGAEREVVLKLASGIESNSNHPLAKCICEYCGDGYEVTGFEYVIGRGACAEYGGLTYKLGNAALMSGIKIPAEVRDKVSGLEACGKTVIYLADDKKLLAVFGVTDAVKPTSAQAIELLKRRGVKLAMLTGDGKVAAKYVAESVGLDDFIAEVMPADKLLAVENMQKCGATVAMVGDGINDSPALKKADIGVAIGDGTDVAIDSAGVVLVGGDLRALDTAIDLSRATVRNIKQNLFWAFFYNVIMIPIAAGALAPVGFTFEPMLAAACMSLSSLFVVGNALRLLRYKNKNFSAEKFAEIKEDEYMKKIISIEGMCCEHCAARVEKTLSAVSGVVSADVKLKKNIAVVRSREEVSDDEIKKVIEEAGYKVTAIESK